MNENNWGKSDDGLHRGPTASRVQVDDSKLALIGSLLKEKASARDRCDFEMESELRLEIERVKQEAGIGAVD